MFDACLFSKLCENYWGNLKKLLGKLILTAGDRNEGKNEYGGWIEFMNVDRGEGLFATCYHKVITKNETFNRFRDCVTTKSLKSARENCKNQFYIGSIFVDRENDSKILS